MKYYTHQEVADEFNVSLNSVKNYIKVLDKDFKRDHFNENSQPDEIAKFAIYQVAKEKNPHISKYESYEKEIENLKKEIQNLEEEKETIKIEYIKKVEELYTKLVDSELNIKKSQNQILALEEKAKSLENETFFQYIKRKLFK